MIGAIDKYYCGMDNKVTRSRGLQLAIDQIGGPGALADALGVNRSTVNSWWRVPPARVAAVARVTGLAESEIAGRNALVDEV